MTVTVPNLPYSFCPASSSQSNQGFMFKNAYDAWFYNTTTSTATQITDTDYPSYHSYTLATLGTSQTATIQKKTWVGATLSITSAVLVTGFTPEAHHMQVGDTITVTNAYFAFVIGTFTVASTPTPTSFTYAISGGSFVGSTIFGTVQGGRDAVVTTETAHTLTVGNSVVITDNATYAGTYTITKVPSPTTYEFTSSVATLTSGTATSTSSSSTMAIGETLDVNTISIGSSITVTGATPSAYNVTASIKYASGKRFGYTFAGGTSPATGAITIGSGNRTVPGIVFIDGYFVVMDENCKIYNSALNDALTWNALDFVVAQIEPGAGKAIAKSQNYVIAFKEWSTEFFYDAANATGSPLSTVGNGFNLIGCASGDSVAALDGTLFWVSQTRQKGRGVHMMQGLQEAQISTPDVERILNLSTLATVYSFGVKIAGHAFYVLTLVDQNITLVYDMTTKVWTQWSSLTAGTPVNVTSITLSGTTATVVTATAHNLTDGDPVNIAGANQAAYNGIKVTSYVNSTTFTFETTAGTTTPATGTITATPYTETYFKYTKYVNALGKDLVQHETNGTLCELTETAYSDVGNPVNVLIRTGKIDGGNMNYKTFNTVEIIGNKVAGTAYVRFSDDDYVTYSKYQPVNLNLQRSIRRRLGKARRRSFDVRYLENASLQIGELDIDVV